MEVKEIEHRIVAVLVTMCPERINTISNPDNTMKEHLEFLEVLSKYIMFDKEAAVREAYELGKFEGENK